LPLNFDTYAPLFSVSPLHSNRAAALLSLKRYHAAASDARRAVALAPSFGKAHARLGQSLYFLKDYAGAVAAYEDAIHYEPDNQVTRTYLEKAKAKMERQKAKMRGEEVSLHSETTAHHYVPSVATDPDYRAGVVSANYGGDNRPLASAAAKITPNSPNRKNHNMYNMNTSMNTTSTQQDDPDFDEAVRIQHRANEYLAHKSYKAAIEEYTAALFLVPDDPNLSSDLHLGRAHALNGR